MTIADKLLSLQFIQASHWGYLIVLLATLTESLPVIGMAIPGHTIVIVGGFLAKLKILNFWVVVATAAIGAIIGDLVAYLLGKKYGYEFINRYGKYFLFKQKHYEKTKELMHEHTWITLILGRFYFVTRAFAAFIAGSSEIPFSRYLICNIIGGVSLAFSAAAVGYIFGKSYEIASKYLGLGVFIALVASIAAIITYKFINKQRHIFNKYHLKALVLSIASLYIFTKMLDDVVRNEMITKFDVFLNGKIMVLWNPSLTKVMIFITNIVSTKSLIILSAILLCVFIYKKWRYNSWLLVSSLLAGVGIELLIKNIVHRIRPDNALIEVSGYSFPSGHAITSVIFFSLLMYSFKDEIKNAILKACFIAANIILFLLIGFSRLYLGAHWFSDVIGGFALGLFLVTAGILVFKFIISLRKKNVPIISDI